MRLDAPSRPTLLSPADKAKSLPSNVRFSDAEGRPSAVLHLEPRDELDGPRYTSREVLDMLGVKKREVRQWLGPPRTESKQGTGKSAVAVTPAVDALERSRPQGAASYTRNDVQLLRSAKELRQEDVPARKIRAAFASLKRRLPAESSPLALQLVAEGKTVVVRDNDGTWDAASGQRMFDFASNHSLWPLDAAVPERKSAGELTYTRSGEASPAPSKVLNFTDRRNQHDSAQAWYTRARDLELAGEDGAIEAYRQALRLEPEMVDAQIDLGRLLHEQGDLKQARVHYEHALEADSTSAVACFNRAVVLEDLGHHDRAVEAYTDALSLDPLHADAYYNLARLYEIRGDRQAALRCLQSYRRVTRS